jgi:N6-adenosine-specific RNA methylase IME4
MRENPSVLARLFAVTPRKPRVHSVMCADPPWSFDDGLPGATRGADKQYSVLTAEDIAARRGLRFEWPLLSPTCVLFLWRVSSQVEEAYATARAWGFEPKSEVVWLKRTKNGKRHFGMGRTVRAEHETCIIAARGQSSKLILAKNVRSTFEAPMPVYQPDDWKVQLGKAKVGDYIHSGKPEIFYTDVVEKVARGPYVELFARRNRPGWTMLGDEVPS